MVIIPDILIFTHTQSYSCNANVNANMNANKLTQKKVTFEMLALKVRSH